LTKDRKIEVFGEVLFDVFPDNQRVLGGAPFNVAWHLQAFGQNPLFVSRIGRDADGEAVRTAMMQWGMDTTEVQSDPARPTGRVAIHLEDGQPTYDILSDQAYDAISPSEIQNPECAFLYHGTLALRSAQSRRALERLKSAGDCKVFMDVNLRDPWWSLEDVLHLADDAHWVKLNEDELGYLAPGSADLVPKARSYLRAHRLRGIIVTRGARGAFALTDDGSFAEVEPSAATHIADTVGAGDAFAAVMITGILQEWPLAEMLQRAQLFASLIVGQRGAIVSDRALYESFVNDWNF
jgi:fructokinase